jgi:ketosteroid isomerase-like protein
MDASPDDTPASPAPQDEPALLAANQAFYDAFERRDAAAMAAVWSDRDAIACIHPGWDALVGREAVLDSWRRLFTNPGQPTIRCRDAKAVRNGEAAFVLCYEVIEGHGMLVATNSFVREAEGWRMVHHQASPLAAPPRRESRPPAARLH